MSFNRVTSKAQARELRFEEIEYWGGTDSARSGGQDHRAGRNSLEQVEREAFQKGFEAGRSSGLEVAQKRLDAVLGRFTHSLAELDRARSELIRKTQEDLVRLSVEIARKLVHREIQVDPDIITGLVQAALGRLKDAARVTVTLNPEDYEWIVQRLEKEPELLGEREVELKASRDLERGDCIVECPFGMIDARISEQFKRIEQGLLSQF
ncbi:MAG TPA: FliH/SctL family protein [Acidobacteriota bacterium]|nr:FliH/SctL family protein [Acidobacteriota bacterium]